MSWRTTIKRALRIIRRDPRRAFFKQWVQPTSIVFDVGAHHGELSEIFQACGATVVAVEPQRACHQALRAVLRPQDTLIDAAIGAAPGNGPLFIGQHAETATLSRDFLRAYGPDAETTTPQEQRVRITTLDKLIERFGMPSFIKIDIEGFESEAVQGLSQAPPALSFEMNERLVQVVIDVVERLDQLSQGYWFRFSPYEHYTWSPAPALKAHDFIEWLSTTNLPKTGDIYAFIDRGQ